MTSKTRQPNTTGRFSATRAISCWPIACAVIILTIAGCNQPGGGGGIHTTQQSTPSSDAAEENLWTIRCLRSTAPNHAELVRYLGEMLRATKGIRANDVRIESDATGSTIYYGRYERTMDRDTGQLSFPPQMQQDLELLRTLTLENMEPFAMAVPEPISQAPVNQRGEWHVSRAKGTHTLLIAIFYNTPTFQQRREVAEEYTRQLRDEGVSAYYLHEQVKSYVFVGDFTKADFTMQNGQWIYGPAITNMIEDRPQDEFKYLTENGHIRKYPTPTGVMQPRLSQLIEVPGASGDRLWNY